MVYRDQMPQRFIIALTVYPLTLNTGCGLFLYVCIPLSLHSVALPTYTVCISHTHILSLVPFSGTISFSLHPTYYPRSKFSLQPLYRNGHIVISVHFCVAWVDSIIGGMGHLSMYLKYKRKILSSKFLSEE